MKTFKSAIVLIIIALGTITAYSNTATIGNMWKQIGSILYPADDVTGISITGDLTVDGFIHGQRTHAILTEAQDAAYTLSTSFTQITSFQTYDSSSNITAANNSITLDTGDSEEFYVLPSFSIESHAGHSITLAVMLNATTNVMERSVRLGGGHVHNVILASYSGGVTVDSGSIANLASNDGVYLILSEGDNTNTPGAVITFTYDGHVAEPNEVNFNNFLYDGHVNHENKIYAWNYVFSRYTALTENANDLPHAAGTDAYRYYNRTFKFPEPHRDYASGGEARVRSIHAAAGTDAHTSYFDEVTLLDNHAGASISFIDRVALTTGDVLTLHAKSEEEDTHVVIKDAAWAMWEVSDQ